VQTAKWRRKMVVLFMRLYSMVVFLFVRVLIQPPPPPFLTLTPSTWHTPPLFFHRMSWNMCPILFRHLNASRDFACSITLFSLFSFFHDTFLLHFSRDTFFDTLLFSHDATPFSSNLIEMNDSAKFFFFFLPFIKVIPQQKDKAKMQKKYVKENLFFFYTLYYHTLTFAFLTFWFLLC